METFKGKAIRQPKSKAAEYAEWACDFYVDGSCGCSYRLNKTGCFKAILGGKTPTRIIPVVSHT